MGSESVNLKQHSSKYIFVLHRRINAYRFGITWGEYEYHDRLFFFFWVHITQFWEKKSQLRDVNLQLLEKVRIVK